jgi:putative aldouronate transport system substrate-binding protein
MYAKMLRSTSTDDFKYIMYDDAAGVHFQPFFYCLCRAWPSDKNLVNYRAVTAAFQNNDTSKLIPEQLSIYNTMTTYKNGKNSSWGMTTINKQNGSYWVIGNYFDKNMLLMNAFYGADTPTMTTQKAALDKLEIETFTKIIMGDPIDNFDSFVTNAMSLGGTAIQKEVNDWYAAQAK